MPSTTTSIIISAASAVGKTFLIGASGYYAVKRPVGNPYLPKSSINMLSRFSFYILLLPLIYSGIASSVTLESLNSLWFVIVASIVIIIISYLVATLLAYLPFFKVHQEENFDALRVAISFPNIVALPIIIFPALCEFEVFHEFGNIVGGEDESSSSISLQENMAICEAEANAVVFTYFFGFSILFWSFGNRTLQKLRITQPSNNENSPDDNNLQQSDIRHKGNQNCCESFLAFCKRILFLIYGIMKDIFMSPGFIVLILAFATACIKPLQDALFVPGGALRVIGSTLESLSSAGATIATMVVAAALADDSDTNDETEHSNNENWNNENLEGNQDHDKELSSATNNNEDVEKEMLVEAQQITTNFFRKIIKHPTFKVQVWHVLSRLFVTPAVIFAILLKIDCIVEISNIAKLVLLINSSLPGALIVVVLLKANGCTKAASIVSQTYLPSYTLSVVTIAAWASIGMMTFDGDVGSC